MIDSGRVESNLFSTEASGAEVVELDLVLVSQRRSWVVWCVSW
jgi:hypothetical protein